MNKIFSILSAFTILLFISCIKNDDVIYKGTVAEIDQTTWNANFTGLTYPILTRVPASGRVVGTTTPNGPDSTLRRYSGTIRVRINLVGAQSATAQTVGYTVFNADTSVKSASFPATLTAAQAPPSGQTPTAAAATLTVANAVAGTHYQTLSGIATIPANSSFGFIEIPILNPGTSILQARFLGIQLNSSGTVPASLNYSQLGLFIDQR